MLAILLIPIVTGLLCFFIPKPKLNGYLSLIGMIITSILTARLCSQIINNNAIREGIFYLDSLSSYVLCVIVFLSMMSTAYSIEYLGHELSSGLTDKKYVQRFYLLLNMFVASMILVVTTENIAIMWIAIEATTIISAPLIGLGFTKRELAIEAAWKYIILCTVGITFALLGTFIAYYGATNIPGESGSLSFVVLKEYAKQFNPVTMKLAFIFIIVGYGTKAGLAPLHSWLPDAHSQAPTPVSALLSGILLNTAFYGVLRFMAIVQPSVGSEFTNTLFLVFGLFSIAIASIFLMVQGNFKRLLAYSSIEHMGIISFGFGIGGKLATYGALLHVLNHAIAKPLMFFVSGKIQSRFGSTSIDRVCDVISKMPVLGVLTFIGILSLAGSPPLNVFISEFTILKAAADAGKWLPLALFLFFVIFVFFGLLSNFGKMLFKSDCKADITFNDTHSVAFDEILSYVVMILLAILAILLGIYVPETISMLIRNSVELLGVR